MVSPSKTPILDLEMPPPSSRKSTLKLWQWLLISVGIVVLLVAASALLLQFPRLPDQLFFLLNGNNSAEALFTARGFDSDTIWGLLNLLWTLTAFYAGVVLHEAGHLIAGRLAGFKFRGVGFGPILFVRKGKRLTVRWIRVRGYEAAAYMEVPSIVRCHRRYAAFAAGGICANILTLVIGLSVFQVWKAEQSLLGLWLHRFVAFSAVLALLNAASIRSGRVWSDGAKIRIFFSRDIEPARRFLGLIGLRIQMARGLRPAQCNRRWVHLAGGIRNGTNDAFLANWLAYAAANSLSESEEASYYLEYCLSFFEGSTVLRQEQLALEACIFMAWFRSDVDKAKEWLRRAPGTKKNELSRYRAKCVLHWVNGELDSALEAWAKVLQLIDKSPSALAKDAVLAEWNEWRSELVSRKPGEPLVPKRLQRTPAQPSPVLA